MTAERGVNLGLRPVKITYTRILTVAVDLDADDFEHWVDQTHANALGEDWLVQYVEQLIETGDLRITPPGHGAGEIYEIQEAVWT